MYRYERHCCYKMKKVCKKVNDDYDDNVPPIHTIHVPTHIHTHTYTFKQGILYLFWLMANC